MASAVTFASKSPVRIALWTVAALSAFATLLLLIVTLALPGWVMGRGAALAGEALGRPVNIDEASFQPWRLALILEGVSIGGSKPGQPALLTLKKLDAALSLRSLLRGHAVVESLSLDEPVLRLTRLDEGRYDIDDLIHRFTAAPGAADAADPEFAVYNIELRNGRMDFDDRPVRRRHELSALHLALPFVSTLPADVQIKLLPRLSGKLDGVAFDSRAEALPFADDASARLSFKFAGLDLAPLAAYVPATVPARLGRGTLDVDLALDFAERPQQPAGVKLSGLVQLHDLALTQPDGKPWLEFKRLSLPLADVQPLRRQLALGHVVLEGPQAWHRPLPAGPANSPSGPPWRFSVGGVEVRDGQFNLTRDLALEAIQLKLGAAAWPLKDEARLEASLRLGDARLAGQARLTPDLLEADAELNELPLERLAPLLPLPGGARLFAALSSKGGLRVEQPLVAGAAARAQLALTDVRASNLRLSLPDVPRLLVAAAVRLDTARVDLATHRVTVGHLALDAPQAQVARDADGRLDLAALLPAGDPGASDAQASPWRIDIATATMDRAALRWRDAAVPAGTAAVAVIIEPLKVQLGALSWPAAAPVPAQLTAQVAALGPNDRAVAGGAGKLAWQGRFGLAPLSAKGSLQAEALPLQLFDAYLDPAWGLHFQRAEVGLRADITATRQAGGAWQAQLGGDARVGPLALLQARMLEGQRVVGEDLLSWQLLQLDGIDLALAPGAPPRLSVREAQLDDAYARLIVNEQGRFNLRDIGPAEAASAPTLAASAPAVDFSAGRIRVNRGLVDFNDRFVRPNYSARLSELQGSLGAFSSTSPAMAPLTLKGRVAGTGVLEIDGQLRPGSPPVMDIAANATDIELAPLSPYAAKYAGYAIERGKLSTKLRYQVDPGGRLVANNEIILNQLTFGSRVESPDATSLPVRFAVALLKDRNGVIDVNLPVSGSLSDPEFSVGGLVWRLVLNLIGKALTSPFALFSGSDSPEEAQIAFLPGSAELAAIDQLDRIAQLLIDKPGVQLTLTGRAGIAAEGQALREQRLARALSAEAGATPADALKRLYEATALPNKPKNLLGFAKDLPPSQMRGLLLGSYAVDDEMLRQLANARATAVRDALLARGAPNARVFLAAPKLCDQGCDETWRPHVELSLGAH